MSPIDAPQKTIRAHLVFIKVIAYIYKYILQVFLLVSQVSYKQLVHFVTCKEEYLPVFITCIQGAVHQAR